MTGASVPRLAAQAQVLRYQRRQEGHAARAVREDVEKLRAYPLPVVHDPEGLRVARCNVHGCAGRLRLRRYDKAPLCAVYVVPEYAAAHRSRKKGEARKREVQRRLEQLRLHRRVQIGREPEHRHPAVRHRHGVDLRRVVERIPVVRAPEIKVAQALKIQPFSSLLRRCPVGYELFRGAVEVRQHRAFLPLGQVYPRRQAEIQPFQRGGPVVHCPRPLVKAARPGWGGPYRIICLQSIRACSRRRALSVP